MMRSMICGAMLMCGAATTVSAQYLDARWHVGPSHENRVETACTTCRRADVPRASFQRTAVHSGKWLTALTSAALIMFAQREHAHSTRDWHALLDICRSAPDACAVGSDGRYLRPDAEQLYQRSRAFDRRANRWLFGAQAGLLATTALFIIDLHPGAGPDNIPYPPVRVGMRIAF